MVVTQYLLPALILLTYMSAWFIISLIRKRNDVADVAWGLGFILLTWCSLLLSGSWTLRGTGVCIMVSIWGIRLAWHIHRRNRGKAEDYRYQEWRRQWGKYFYLRSYFQVYFLQGIFLYLIVIPVLIINNSADRTITLLDGAGLLIWIIGFLFESIGDAQLAVFVKNPANKGTFIQSGLWKYSRHPNYFGEVTQWWGIAVIALSVNGGYIGLIGPAVITFLILKVSGIPLLEANMSKRPGFEAYKKRISVFIPLPPKSK